LVCATRCRSTATANRWRSFTRGWTCGSTSDAERMNVCARH
jgi:hypothetical protein